MTRIILFVFLVGALNLAGPPVIAETVTQSISGGWTIYKEDNPLFSSDPNVSPFTCVAQATSTRGQVLNLRVFPKSYQVNIELPYFYGPNSVAPSMVYFDTEDDSLFLATASLGVNQATAQLYDGNGYTLLTALQPVADFEVGFQGARYAYNGLKNRAMLAALMACAERQLTDFNIPSY